MPQFSVRGAVRGAERGRGFDFGSPFSEVVGSLRVRSCRKFRSSPRDIPWLPMPVSSMTGPWNACHHTVLKAGRLLPDLQGYGPPTEHHPARSRHQFVQPVGTHSLACIAAQRRGKHQASEQRAFLCLMLHWQSGEVAVSPGRTPLVVHELPRRSRVDVVSFAKGS